MRIPGLLVVASTLLVTTAFADDRRIYALEDRVNNIEQRLRSSNMLSIAEDVRQLQTEIRQLRGEVERLQYENDQAKVRQREMYLDLERRIQALEQSRVQVPATTPGPVSPASGQIGTDTGAPAQTTTTQPAAGVQGEEQTYLAAFELLKQGRYPEAIKGFDSFLQQYPQSDYADNAQYWLAEAYYVSRDFPQSLVNFQRLVDVYPQSSKLPGALLKMGYIFYERGDYQQARAALSRVTREFPESSAASLARQRLQRMDTEGR